MVVRIDKLTTSSGYLERATIELHEGMTAIIGPPGTCKSTIVETIRHLFDQDAESVHDRIAETLASGIARCEVTVGDGRMAIQRGVRSAAPSYLPIGGGNVAPELAQVEIYSQGELQKLAQDISRRLALLDSPNEEAIRALEERREEARRAHANACALLRPRIAEIAVLEPAVSGLGTAKERLEDHERAKPKIPARLEAEREKHEARQSILAGLDRELPRLRAALDDLAKHAELALEARALGEALAEHDTSPARILSTTLLAAAKVIEVAARAAEKVDLECGPSLGSEIAKAFSRLDRPYLELLDKEKGLSAWTKAQNDLKKDVADVEAKAKQLGLARREEAKLLDERKRALGELDHVRSEIGRVREAEVAHVKRAAPKDVRIHLEKDGDRRAYAQALAVLFQNSRVNRQPELVALLVESFSPRALVAVMEADGGGAQLDKLTGRNDGAKVAGWLTGRDGFHDLEALGLDDRLDIGLVQDGIEKPIEKLSNGQRAIALLPLILRPGTIPIVFDQPEDDVDNTYMVEIARRLRQLKRGRQIIIVTHDANLVVLGDADRVIVMSMESSKRAVVAKTGTVNDCRDEILLLLEGGEEAFRARAESYDMGDSLDPDGSTEEDEEEADSKDSRR